jgi:arylsulfatase
MLTGRFLATFEGFPPRQEAPSFSVDQAMERLEASFTTGR